ncbi:MAG: hypothetical protein NZ531_02595, partial [Aquificaceae bacterium]|nr:hypothetical protein [Aquificaceae bacterium]
DINSGKVLDMKVTDNRTHDSQCAIELQENSRSNAEAEGRQVKEEIADTGSDTPTIIRQLAERREANGYGRRGHVESR